MTKQALILGLMFVTLSSVARNKNDLETIRSQFQVIESEEDIENIILFEGDSLNSSEDQMIKAYKAAATCMMANYVFSPKAKLKYFNEGKKELETLISSAKEVENVYLRLLLQLNVPKVLNYNENIEEDVAFLEENMAESEIDLAYKNIMIENLVSVTKKKDLKETLLQIKLV